MTINIGIIGCGQIARFHLEALKETKSRVIAVSDVNERQGQALADQIGASFVADYRQMLANAAIQVIMITTPNHTHYQIAVDAIEAGKDVFCEKPMTTRPEESADLVARMRRRSSQIFQVGYMKRYNPGFGLVKELLPQLGELVSVHVRIMVSRGPRSDSWYSSVAATGGGVLYHSGSHLLDVTRWLFGDPQRISSRWRGDPEDPQRDEITLSLLDMENGPPIYFSTLNVPIAQLGHTQQGWEETIEVIGLRGRILLSSPNWQGTLPCVVQAQIDGESQHRTIYPPPTSQWMVQDQAFIQAITNRTQLHPDVVDGYKVDEILAAIRESGQRQEPVAIRWRI